MANVAFTSRKPLATALTAVFALSASPLAFAATVPVTLCTESAMRSAITAASSGDTVDMTSLPSTCTSITLASGSPITIVQSDLTLLGPGAELFSILGTASPMAPGGVLLHTGNGTLKVSHITLADGVAIGNASGGCINSASYVDLDHAVVDHCTAGWNGGGIYAQAGVISYHSTISNNTANGNGGGLFTASTGQPHGRPESYGIRYSKISNNSGFNGGGLYVRNGSVTLTNSTISGNYAIFAGGGSLTTWTNINIYNTTFSGNISQKNVGGVSIAGNTVTLRNSTISGNQAGGYFGGAYVSGYRASPTVWILNSTIASNTAVIGAITRGYVTSYVSPGLVTSSNVVLKSSLLANNTYGSPAQENDLSVLSNTPTPYPPMVSGDHNLVRATHSAVPGDTIIGACPLLGPLRNNGGLTMTHSLLSQSPAIDKGSNPENVNEDQRGQASDTRPFPYARVSGAAADIGAYEVQQSDIIFNTSFEGCP